MNTATSAVLRARIMLGCVMLFGLSGCHSSDLLNVSEPDLIQTGSLADAAGAEALRAGAIAQLEAAVGGNQTNGLITVSGALTDELVSANTRAGLVPIDQRAVDENNEGNYATVIYQRLQRARALAVQATAGFQKYAPAAKAKIGQMHAVAGYAELLLAEAYCSGVPLSEVNDGATAYGQPLSSTDLLATALAQFDSALVFGKDSAAINNLAKVGRARTLLDLGRFADAASASADVPAGFVYNLEYSATTALNNNGVYVWITAARVFSVADREGGVGLDYRSAADPRLKLVAAGIGQDARTPIFSPAKYSGLATPIPLADGTEAALIQAEAALKSGDRAGWLAKVNTLRASLPGLGVLADPSTDAARVDAMFRERAFWLFATAHRLGDLRRLVRQYGRSVTAVFPSGSYFQGGDYGAEVTLPIPFSERNNPNFTGCMDRNA